MNEDVVLRETESMHARWHPRAILGIWAWVSILAFFGSLPAVAFVRAAYGAAPDGDALLWRAGSLPLVALLSQEGNGVRASVATAAAILAFGAVAGLLPLAALLNSIAYVTSEGRAIGAARAVGAAVRGFRPLAIVLVAVTTAQGLFVAAAFACGDLAEAWTHAWLGEAGAQMLGIGVASTWLPAALAVGVMHDLSRAAVVRFDLGAVEALVVAGRALRGAPLAVAISWAWRSLASAAPVLAVSLFAGHVGGRGGWTLAVLAVLHQSVVLARVAFRASWLAKALRIIDAMRSTLPSRTEFGSPRKK